MKKRIEVKKGDRYGKLTIVKEVDPHVYPNGKKKRMFVCRCDCDGKEIKVRLEDLRSGHTTSCGCHQKEMMKKVDNPKRKQNLYLFHKSGVVIGYTYKLEPFYLDKEDYEKVKECCWRIEKGYVVARLPKTNKRISMHRLVTDCPKGMVVDHINHNTADNRKSNLRICTISDNNKNKSVAKNSKSGVNGVTWYEKGSKWLVRINADGKQISLGYFSNKEDAIKARIAAEKKYYGEFANNNGIN